MIIVKEGSVNADSFHLCTTDSGSIPTAAITFTQVTPSSGGTVTQVGIAQAGSEFTISGSPITTSGNITLGIRRIKVFVTGGGGGAGSQGNINDGDRASGGGAGGSGAGAGGGVGLGAGLFPPPKHMSFTP